MYSLIVSLFHPESLSNLAKTSITSKNRAYRGRIDVIDVIQMIDVPNVIDVTQTVDVTLRGDYNRFAIDKLLDEIRRRAVCTHVRV